MDVTTGKFETFKDEQAMKVAIKTGKYKRVKGLPDPDCKDCYGLGHLGRNILTNEYIPCSCVKFIRMKDEDESEEGDRIIEDQMIEQAREASERGGVEAGAG